MNGFLKWFFVFMSSMLAGFGQIFKGLWNGIKQIFNIKNYIRIFKTYSADFGALGWILSVLAIIVVVAIFVLIIFMIVLAVRKYIRFRHSIVSNEDLIEEISDLQRQVVKMTKEKDEIMAMKVAQLGVYDNTALAEGETKLAEGEQMPAQGEVQTTVDGVVQTADCRFSKLIEVDNFYKTYEPPAYNNDITLSGICEAYRNFACSRMHLYYDIKTIRLFIAGMASTKLIILQGISGTGKTSLPYSFGKFLQKDTTIASVQPSWRDRTELFGYFNEFTKKFNETELLRAMYEASYNDNIYAVILDEMNIARVEYYFAEMLSILEMPSRDEWVVDIIPNSWPSDPKHIVNGQLRIPPNMWYIGTANNDDSTFAITDKVYDRAMPINIDTKGVPFDAPLTDPVYISYKHFEYILNAAKVQFVVSEENIKKITLLDDYVIEHFRIAFGNRIVKQLRDFVPAYVGTGGTELDGLDYVLARKVFRKFESLNISYIRDEIDGLCAYIDELFGEENMNESKDYLRMLKKLV